MLQGASRLVGHLQIATRHNLRQAQCADNLGDVTHQRAKFGSVVRSWGSEPLQLEGDIFQMCTAPRGIGDDEVEAAFFTLSIPGGKGPCAKSVGAGGMAEMVIKGAATARIGQDDNLAAQTTKESNRGIVDFGRYHPLDAACEERDPGPPRTNRSEHP